MATGAECEPARTLTLILTLPEPGAECDLARTLTLILTLPEPGAACDLSSLASVRAFAASQEGKPLDTLVLNAGLSLNVGDKEEQFTQEG